MNIDMLFPIYAMITLTVVIWLALGITRARRLIKYGTLDEIAGQEKTTFMHPTYTTNISDNFKNLFEVPVLFYAVTMIIFSTYGGTETDFYLAVAFVGTRAIHSFIHCTYNAILHRFIAYAISSLILWTLAIKSAIYLLS